jgi:hypothetical protein
MMTRADTNFPTPTSLHGSDLIEDIREAALAIRAAER